MVVSVMHDMANGLLGMTHAGDLWHSVFWHLSHDSTVLAQQLNEDVFADFRKAVDHFIKSGQVWALLVGVVLGYLFRSLTSYG